MNMAMCHSTFRATDLRNATSSIRGHNNVRHSHTNRDWHNPQVPCLNTYNPEHQALEQ